MPNPARITVFGVEPDFTPPGAQASEARRYVLPLVQIRLPFISEAQIEREISLRMPIIAKKYTNVFLIYGKRWNAGIDGELRSTSTESPDLSGGKAHALEQECAAVTLNRIDIHELRLSRRVEHWLIVCIQ